MSPYSRLNLAPCPVRIKRLDRACRLRGVEAEILLIDDTVVAHDEGHDSRDAVLGRERNERESPNHVTPDDEIVGAPGRIGPSSEGVYVSVLGRPLACRRVGTATSRTRTWGPPSERLWSHRPGRSSPDCLL